MEGQKIMKHSDHLINCPVQVTTMEWHRPDIPRAGVITGFGAKEGLFNVAVLADHSLDIRVGKSPILYVNNVLVVDDEDDTPVGVHQYARIYQPPMSSQLLRKIDSLYKTAGAPIKIAETEETEAAPEETEAEETQTEELEDAEDLEESESKGPEVVQEDEVEEESSQDIKQLPAGTPIKKLQISPQFAPVAEIDGIFCAETGDNELSITIDDDQKPIARITWKDPPQGRGLVTEPFGFSVKVRDSGGRCSRTMGLNMPRPEMVGPVLECLAGAIKAALSCELGDYGSTTENMTEWVNKSVALG